MFFLLICKKFNLYFFFREAEWLFSTREGRSQLANSTQVGRLLVVHLNREHHYNNQDQIQSELSGYVMELAPYDLPRNTKVPFLSLGGEIDVGIRQERCRGKSETSGGISFIFI